MAKKKSRDSLSRWPAYQIDLEFVKEVIVEVGELKLNRW